MNRTIPAGPAALAAALDIENDTTAALLAEMAADPGPYASGVTWHGVLIEATDEGGPLVLAHALRGPFCELRDAVGNCGHDSCRAVYDEAPWTDQCPKGHGWQHVTDAGSGSGFAGGAIYWTVLECGHTLMDESGDVAAAR
jgi:hypothetical protein